MDLFDKSGHITDEGFTLLLQDAPNLLDRLELTEHLSFCDKCCARYADLLTGDVLLMPPAPVAPDLMERIRRRSRTIFFNRFVKVGLAASLAMGLWLTGINYGIIDISPRFDQNAQQPHALSATADTSNGFNLDEGSQTGAGQFMARQQENAKKLQASFDAVAAKSADDSPTLNMKISLAVENLLSSITHKGDQ